MPDSHNQREPSAEELFALLIKERREALSWSQEELARRVSQVTGAAMHQTAVTRMESGRRNIRLNEALVMARVLGIDMGRLDPLGGSDNRAAEREFVSALEQAEAIRAEQDTALYKLQIEMESTVDRYYRMRAQLEETDVMIEHLRGSIESIRKRIEEDADGER